VLAPNVRWSRYAFLNRIPSPLPVTFFLVGRARAESKAVTAPVRGGGFLLGPDDER
jgi:hypothetical protein